MNKITIRTVTRGYVIEVQGNPGEYGMEYAAESIDKVTEIIKMLLNWDASSKIKDTVAVEAVYDDSIGCRHEWEASSNSASGYKCRVCGAFRAY